MAYKTFGHKICYCHFGQYHFISTEEKLNFKISQNPCYHRGKGPSLYWSQFMLQWFIRFREVVEFTEFLFHLEKTEVNSPLEENCAQILLRNTKRFQMQYFSHHSWTCASIGNWRNLDCDMMNTLSLPASSIDLFLSISIWLSLLISFVRQFNILSYSQLPIFL